MNFISLFSLLSLWAIVLLTSVEVVCAQEPSLEPAAIHSIGNYAASEKGSYAEESVDVSLRELDLAEGHISPVPANKAATINKRSSIKFDHGIRAEFVWTWVLIIAIAVLATLLLLYLRTTSLKKKVKKRTTELNAANQILKFEITERKQAEERLQKSEGKYKTLLENLPQKIFLKDTHSAYISCSENYARDLGILPEEIEGKRDDDFFPRELADKYREDDRRIFESGKTEKLEEQYLQDGKKTWVSTIKIPVRNDSGAVTGLLGVFLDISDRKQTEEALLVSEEKFRTLVTNTEEIVYMIAKDGTFLLSEGKGLSQLGVKPGEVVGKSVFELYKDYPDMLEEMRRAFNGESVSSEVNIDGHYFRSWFTPHKNHAGEIIGLLGLSVNITEQKQAEEKLQEYQQRLKLLAVQMTLAEERERRRIAEDLHDHIGQSLALARMQLAAARKGLQQSDKRDAQFDDISQSLLKAIQDTRHLIFELSSPSLNELGLAAAISEWMDEYVVNKHGVEAEFFDHTQALSMNNDLRALLFRNVRELLSNAIKHADAKTISVLLESRAENLEITIQDDGVGFDPDNCRRNGEDCGGFGLFSVSERMTDLGGKLMVSSEPGAGCKAVLVLPIHKLNSETEA